MKIYLIKGESSNHSSTGCPIRKLNLCGFLIGASSSKKKNTGGRGDLYAS